MFLSNSNWFWWMVIEFRWMVIEFRWMVIEFRWMVIKFRWMVIKIGSKLVELLLISMNGHQNQKQIGQNNHFQTLFYNHFYILSNCNWFRWNVIEFSGIVIEFSGIVIEYRAIWSKQSPPNTIITSKHYNPLQTL